MPIRKEWSEYINPDNIDKFKAEFGVTNFTYDTYANNDELLAVLGNVLGTYAGLLVAAGITRFASAGTGGALAAGLLVGYGAADVALFGARWVLELVPPLGAAAVHCAILFLLFLVSKARTAPR